MEIIFCVCDELRCFFHKAIYNQSQDALTVLEA